MTQKRKTLYRRLAAIGLLPLAALALAPDFDLGSALPLLATEQAEPSKPADAIVAPEPQSQGPKPAPVDEELTFDETAFALNDPQPTLEAGGNAAPVNTPDLLVAFEPNFKSGMSNFLGGRSGPQASNPSGSIKPVIGTTAPHPSTGGGAGKPGNDNGNPPHEDQAGPTPGDKPATGNEPATDDPIVGTGPSDDNPTLPNDPLPGNPDNPLPNNPDDKPVATVPEPSSLVLLVVGVIGLLIARRRIA